MMQEQIDALSNFVRYEMCFFLVAIVALVGYKILTGKINMNGLLDSKDGSGQYSPARLQLLLSTLTGAFYFIAGVVRDPSQFPQVPNALLYGLGGSHLLYLGSKTISQIFNSKEQ